MIETLQSFANVTGIYSFMHSAWGWPVIESLHFIGLSLLLGTVGIYDLRMLGVARGISYSDLQRLVPFGVAGYSLNVLTGTMFVVSAPDQYLYNPAFLTKLTLMLVAGCNMLGFYWLFSKQVLGTPPALNISARGKVVAWVSLSAWTGVIICGRLITYYRPPYHWCLFC